MSPFVEHLDTFARAAGDPPLQRSSQVYKKLGSILRVPMARANPRRIIKQAKRPVGNLPLEILSHLSAYLTEQFDLGTFTLGIAQMQAMNSINDLHGVLATTDRVLNTPLPLAYQITISQISWVYIITLPFQLTAVTRWLCIPISVVTAYIVLSMLYIGNEIENPFGEDVNDLPLEIYCDQIVTDINVIAAISPKRMKAQVHSPNCKLLYPYSLATREFWSTRSESDIRTALRDRGDAHKTTMWDRLNNWKMGEAEREECARTDSDTVCEDCEIGRCKTGNEGQDNGQEEKQNDREDEGQKERQSEERRQNRGNNVASDDYARNVTFVYPSGGGGGYE